MMPLDCPELNDCPKIIMILDKDIFDFQVAEAIHFVCGQCNKYEDDYVNSSAASR